MATTEVQRAAQRMTGLKRLGTPEDVAQAEADLAEAYLERYVERAIADGVDTRTRRRLAQMLIAGEAQQ
jgi:hypothetical protein